MFLHPPTPTPTPTPYLLQLNPALMRHEAQLWGLDGDLTGPSGGGTIYKQYRVFAGWNMNKTFIVKVGFPIAAMAFSCGAQLFL